MHKAFKYRLYPNKEQARTLFWTLTRCRELVRHFWRVFDSFTMKERLGVILTRKNGDPKAGD